MSEYSLVLWLYFLPGKLFLTVVTPDSLACYFPCKPHKEASQFWSFQVGRSKGVGAGTGYNCSVNKCSGDHIGLGARLLPTELTCRAKVRFKSR